MIWVIKNQFTYYWRGIFDVCDNNWIMNFTQWRKIKIDIWLITIKISLIRLLAKAINVATVNSVMFFRSLHVCLSISFPLSFSPSVLTLSPLYSLSLSLSLLTISSPYLSFSLCPPPPILAPHAQFNAYMTHCIVLYSKVESPHIIMHACS